MRDQLRRLHVLAGGPTADKLLEHADRCGHSVKRSALAAVPTGTGGLRWATVAAFIDACTSYAKTRGQPLPPHEADMLVWRTKYDQAYPGQRKDRPRPGPPNLTVVGMVPGLADCFQPRALVDELAHATDGEGTAILTGTATAATRLLSGMGGVGKTQLAVHLAGHLCGTGQLDLLVWISATSREAISAGYAHAAVDLALPGAEGADTERDAARFHAWLATTASRWLIVFDDLGTAAALKGLWPPTRDTGRTVVTTRLRGSALSGPGRRLVPVGVFTPTEAATYLQARLVDPPDLADDIDGLADALYHLPVALAHATAYMIDEGVPCTGYQRRLAERGRRLDDLAPPTDELPDDYTRTVAATVSLSVQAADRTRPYGLATPLLNLASVLHPAGIPEPVFTTNAARNWLTYTRTASADVEAADLDIDTIRSGLRCLHRLNLITLTDNTVTVHGLVQRVTRDWITDDHLSDLVWAAADALDDAWPEIERDRAAAQQLRSNTTAVYQHGRNALLQPDTHPVLRKAINSLGNSGHPTAAATVLEQLLADLVLAVGPDHLATLTARGGLAAWRGEAGDPSGAAAAFDRLLIDVLRVLGPNDPHTLNTRHHLAYWRGEAGNPAGAAEATERLLDDLQAHSPDHPYTLATRNNLARWRGEAGDAIGAATAFEQLLTDRLRVLGPDHHQTLKTRHELATWRGKAGDPSGAAAAFDQLLIDVLRVLGPDHPDTLITRGALAQWRGEAGDPAGAVEVTKQVLNDQLRMLSPDHPDALATRAQLAGWYGRTGNPARAAAAYAELLTDIVRVHGPGHPNTLTTRNNLAYWRSRAGDLADQRADPQ
jgi:hypothetical protein